MNLKSILIRVEIFKSIAYWFPFCHFIVCLETLNKENLWLKTIAKQITNVYIIPFKWIEKFKQGGKIQEKSLNR